MKLFGFTIERSHKTPAARLRSAMLIQGCNGNWNANRYMFGLYNGMAVALSILENQESTAIRSAPETFLDDVRPPRNVLVSSDRFRPLTQAQAQGTVARTSPRE